MEEDESWLLLALDNLLFPLPHMIAVLWPLPVFATPPACPILRCSGSCPALRGLFWLLLSFASDVCIKIDRNIVRFCMHHVYIVQYVHLPSL